jgi:hypothetical protein
MTKPAARSFVLLTITLLGAGCAARAGLPAPPATGRQVLERMRRAYEGVWYPQLAFVQKTTFFREGGVQDTMTWFESLRGADQLRIDVGNPTEGRGTVSTADSTFVFRNGTLTRATAGGNPFLPVIQGVYLQPVEVTIRQLAHHTIDAARSYATAWDGRPVWVVGASSADDTTAGQFWVDTERLVAVRMLVRAQPDQPLLDVRLRDYVPVGRAWLATTIDIMQGGRTVQYEEYTEWSTTTFLPLALFNRQRLITEGHWALQPRNAPAWERRTP